MKRHILARQVAHWALGWHPNPTKTNLLSKQYTLKYLQEILIDDFKFQALHSFTYVGSVLDNGNKMWTDSHSIITTANCAHSAYNKLFKSKLLSWNTKIKNLQNFNTTHRPIITYGTEASTMPTEHKCSESIQKEDGNKNLWSHKGTRKVENKNE
jgi:hypothetical protein